MVKRISLPVIIPNADILSHTVRLIELNYDTNNKIVSETTINNYTYD